MIESTLMRPPLTPPAPETEDSYSRGPGQRGALLMGDSLAGRVVLVTGSSRGIGAAVAVKAAAEGARLAIHYRESANEAAQDSGSSASSRFGGRHIRRRRVGRCPGGTARQSGGRPLRTPGRAGQQRRPDPGGSVPDYQTKRVECGHCDRSDGRVPHLPGRHPAHARSRAAGSIVNVASRLGQMGVPETAAYSAAKAGLIGLTRSLAKEFGSRAFASTPSRRS